MEAAKQPTTDRADLTSWTGLPVIFDEVFTGLYRLGRFKSASFLGVQPDISVHAKLLTGGLVPLCMTLASEDIFEAFLSSEKSHALLHGHSYTAHAVGCKVAETSVNMLMAMERDGDWDDYKRDWLELQVQASKNWDETLGRQTEPSIWSTWSKSFVTDLSYAQDVEGVVALGSVLAVSLRDPAGAGKFSHIGSNICIIVCI